MYEAKKKLKKASTKAQADHLKRARCVHKEMQNWHTQRMGVAHRRSHRPEPFCSNNSFLTGPASQLLLVWAKFGKEIN